MIPGCYKCRRFSTDECPHDNEECTRFNACDLYEEQGVNVAKPDACPQLYEVRALGEALCDMEKYIPDESSALGEKFKIVVEKYNKVSEHFV